VRSRVVPQIRYARTRALVSVDMAGRVKGVEGVRATVGNAKSNAALSTEMRVRVKVAVITGGRLVG